MVLPYSVARQIINEILGHKFKMSKFRLSLTPTDPSDLFYGSFYPDEKGGRFAASLSKFILKDIVTRAAMSQASDMAGSVHLSAELALAMNDVLGIGSESGGRFDNVHSDATAIAMPAVIRQCRKMEKNNTSGLAGYRPHRDAVNFGGGRTSRSRQCVFKFRLENETVPSLIIHSFIGYDGDKHQISASNAAGYVKGSNDSNRQRWAFLLGTGELMKIN